MSKLQFHDPGEYVEGTAKTNIRKGQKVRVLKNEKAFTTIGLHNSKIIGIATEEIKAGEKGEVWIPAAFFKSDSHVKIEGGTFL